MPYAENKSLQEYGDLNSMHHTDVQAEREAGKAQLELENRPAFLFSELQLGGSYVIKWSKGDSPVPADCGGLWTGTSQANAQIEKTNVRLAREAEKEAIAYKAKLEKEAITVKKEVAPKPKTTRKKSA